jgi:hypothetical protein
MKRLKLLLLAIPLLLYVGFHTLLFRSSHLVWDDAGDASAVDNIVGQSFFPLGQGGQARAFISRDGRYVLKFFTEPPHSWVPLTNYHDRKEKKFCRSVTGYLLAFNRLPEKTGLIFLHFSHSKAPKVTVWDSLGLPHIVDLSHYPWVLQEWAMPASTFLRIHNTDGSQEAIEQLLASLYTAGLQDGDHRLGSNIGFTDRGPIFIDAGKFEERREIR